MPSPATIVMNRYHGTNVSPSWNPSVPKNDGIWRREAVRVPDADREAHEGEHQTDGDHELRDERRVGEPAHEDALDQRAEQRCGDEDGEQERDERLHAPVDLQLPVDEGQNMPMAPWAKLKMPDVV